MLENLAKLYTNEAKFCDENDSFSFKLTIFHDIYDRANISQLAKLKAFCHVITPPDNDTKGTKLQY